MPDANRVSFAGPPPDEEALVRLVEAQVKAIRLQVAVLAHIVALFRASDRRAAVTETIGAVAHNLRELVRRLHRPEDGS